LTRRTVYRVAGQSLLVEVHDSWTADALDALFAGWYLVAEACARQEPSRPEIVIRCAVTPGPIPAGLDEFEIAGGGTCHTDGRTSYIDIEGSVVAIGKPGLAPVEAWINGPLDPGAPVLTRVVTYALAGALRRRRLFELHSGALVHPESSGGLLVIGPSGSGKSTLTVHLAAAGWSFLTDDVLLLSRQSSQVKAWPLRRCFAITSETFAASRFLQAHTSLGGMEAEGSDKTQFVPHGVFPGDFKDHCIPGTLFFSALTGEAHSRVSRLSPGDTMARLIRMNPWSCYDRPTAADHLAVLSALVRQSTGYALLAGKDLLDPEASAKLIASYTCG
jgi:hypothetical protein